MLEVPLPPAPISPVSGAIGAPARGFPAFWSRRCSPWAAMILRQATVDQTTARRHAVSDRLNLFDREQRHLAQGGAAHLWWGGAASGFSSANVDNRGAEQPITGPGIAGISQWRRNRARRT